MTHRLSLAAFLFGLIATTSIGVAAHLLDDAAAVARPVRHVQLERVVITARRSPGQAPARLAANQ